MCLDLVLLQIDAVLQSKRLEFFVEDLPAHHTLKLPYGGPQLLAFLLGFSLRPRKPAFWLLFAFVFLFVSGVEVVGDPQRRHDVGMLLLLFAEEDHLERIFHQLREVCTAGN